MKIIEFQKWKPSETDPRRREYAGQRTAQEVFEELKHLLDNMGYLPDECFELSPDWEDGRQIPKGADIFCTVDYGESEGVYVDIYLKWFEDTQKKYITKDFALGKTLGENGNDLDRMFLIASAITKAFHGDNATHSRYTKIGGVEEDTGGTVVHLSQQEQLLPEAAGRPGAVGRKMTELLMQDRCSIDYGLYCEACKKAIDINDPEKVLFMVEQAQTCVADLEPSFHGEMAVYAYLDHRYIAKEIIHQCSAEQIAAAPSQLLEQFAMDHDFRTMSELVEKGISGGSSSARTLHMLTYEGRDSWMAESLLEKRMWVELHDYSALHACVQNDAVDTAKLLLDNGMDFEKYQKWAEHRNGGHEETVQALADYWSEMKAEMEQAPAEEMGGQTFG